MTGRDHLEVVHLPGGPGALRMPYVPAIKVLSGKTVYVAGVTAAPVYHQHPHVPADFDTIPADPEAQTRAAMDNLQRCLQAAGGDLSHLVQLFRFIKDLDRNQDAIGRVMAEYLGDQLPTTTTVEVVRLATDPRLVLELTAVAVVPA
jgi:enamine deaminase RidA (YjgF/YER057c/UK114 family)